LLRSSALAKRRIGDEAKRRMGEWRGALPSLCTTLKNNVMNAIKHFRDLDVYQGATALVMHVFELTKRFPSEERYALTDQLRRSSRSVCANLAEAWRKRSYQAAFISKLNDAEGEAAESQVHIEIAFRHSYLGEEVFDELDDAYDKVIGQIVKMIDRPDRWNNQTSKKRLTWKRSYSDETPHRRLADTPFRRFARRILRRPARRPFAVSPFATSCSFRSAQRSRLPAWQSLLVCHHRSADELARVRRPVRRPRHRRSHPRASRSADNERRT
jgi:four helix bundle protein